MIRRTEKGDGYLEQFELMRYLGKDYPLHTELIGEGEETDRKLAPKSVKPRTSIKTEIVFLERIYSLLKPGTGQAAVVLPDGVLTNSSLQGVRHWLMSHFQLLAVVSLPQFAFSHYDAAVKASIVFLRRLASGEAPSDAEAIFMALADNIGYDPAGRKTFIRTVEQEEAGVQKVERHSCDLFDYRVYYEPTQETSEESDWSERRREIIPGTGLVGHWEEFQKDPTPFFHVGPPGSAMQDRFAIRRGTALGLSLSPSSHAPELRHYLEGLRNNVAASKPLSSYVQVNPVVDVSQLDPDDPVSFVPMQAVSNDGVGEYTATNRPLKEVRKGYTPFENGDILWAKITPSMQNGKACIVNGLTNGVGFGSTEFHVIRVVDPDISTKFVFEFITQEAVRRMATHSFTGSAGQQRVPAEFIANLPFPALSGTRQDELLAHIEAARIERKVLK